MLRHIHAIETIREVTIVETDDQTEEPRPRMPPILIAIGKRLRRNGVLLLESRAIARRMPAKKLP